MYAIFTEMEIFNIGSYFLYNYSYFNYEYKKFLILLYFQLISKRNSDKSHVPVIPSTPESFTKDTWST
jgi:hypothetical protein